MNPLRVSHPPTVGNPFCWRPSPDPHPVAADRGRAPRRPVPLDAGRIDRDLWCVDATVGRASRSAAGAGNDPDRRPQSGGPERTRLDEPTDHALGRSRGGFGAEVHLVCDGEGTLLAVPFTAGQAHESRSLGSVLLRARRPARNGRPRWPKNVAGDKGPSYPGIRVGRHRHHIDSVIPTRTNQSPDPNFDKRTHRKRNVIERMVGGFKECRALGTRDDKLAVNYAALWIVANIHRLLKKRLRLLQTGLSERT
jgi:transposase